MTHEEDMTTADFRAHIAAMVGPKPKATQAERPCVRTPEDRGYYPPQRNPNTKENLK